VVVVLPSVVVVPSVLGVKTEDEEPSGLGDHVDKGGGEENDDDTVI
jgi:hypothetical protein